ncbi:XF1762 family protein [Streptomyces atriruber]|uniref:XF1762 family protein n=1 Tax=Streptomyces atriruber TaxID=545121 RepID=UPI000A617D5D|nr:XF1762 family protein [Streptomyces atriruber]
MELHIHPMKYKAACAYVDRIHRHHGAPQGHQFSLGVRTGDGLLVGVAVVGRPVSKHLDNGLTVEVTRLATDGTPNACSALYAAAWRTARSAGYRRAITYTQDGESGASLRAAGWRKAAELPARPGWDAPSRPRRTLGTENVARTRWEITTHNAPPLPELRDETRDETPAPRGRRKRCPECKRPVPRPVTGRPARYCSAACRQRAYRRRTANR